MTFRQARRRDAAKARIRAPESKDNSGIVVVDEINRWIVVSTKHQTQNRCLEKEDDEKEF
jgi:hypothetical protein